MICSGMALGTGFTMLISKRRRLKRASMSNSGTQCLPTTASTRCCDRSLIEPSHVSVPDDGGRYSGKHCFSPCIRMMVTSRRRGSRDIVEEFWNEDILAHCYSLARRVTVDDFLNGFRSFLGVSGRMCAATSG